MPYHHNTLWRGPLYGVVYPPPPITEVCRAVTLLDRCRRPCVFSHLYPTPPDVVVGLISGMSLEASLRAGSPDFIHLPGYGFPRITLLRPSEKSHKRANLFTIRRLIAT